MQGSERSAQSAAPSPQPRSGGGLYERLVDEIPADDLELARRVLELIRARGRLGRLQAGAVEGLEPAELIALRNALAHGRWALPAGSGAGLSPPAPDDAGASLGASAPEPDRGSEGAGGGDPTGDSA